MWATHSCSFWLKMIKIQINSDSHTECIDPHVNYCVRFMKSVQNLDLYSNIPAYTLTMHRSQNSTWKSLHVSHNIVYSLICHKQLHIMGWKDQKSKEIASFGSLFLSAAVVRKQLLDWSGHFLFILCQCNPLAHSVTCMIHMQLQRTAWNVGFHMKQIVEEITVNWDILRKSYWNLCTIHIYTPILYLLTIHGSHMLMCIVKHVW